MSVDDRIATPEGKRRYVRGLFATIADRYDLITVVLSYGQDRRWKRRLVALADLTSGVRVLDVATGTGDIAFECAARGASVTGLDVTQRMVEIARGKGAVSASGVSSVGPSPRFVVGDMMALPFASGSFDVVTTGYGLRNVPDLRTAIEEIRRVLKPGGHFLSLDFNRPPNAAVRSVYLSYLELVGGMLGWLLHRDPDTYRYIPASIRRYPGAAGVVRALQAQGFSQASFYPVLGGLLAIHNGIRD
jgi:demethylmenaquinone methyltransferase / 2-methoxy-6-polyprenyl-1,4-benzoquinol methylase